MTVLEPYSFSHAMYWNASTTSSFGPSRAIPIYNPGRSFRGSFVAGLVRVLIVSCPLANAPLAGPASCCHSQSPVGTSDRGQNSSLAGSILPSSLAHSFRGPAASRVRIVARPSLFTFTQTKTTDVGCEFQRTTIVFVQQNQLNIRLKVASRELF